MCFYCRESVALALTGDTAIVLEMFYQRFKIYPLDFNNTGLTPASIYYATVPKSVFLEPLNSMLDSFNILLSLQFRPVLDNIQYSDSAKTRNSITRTIITQADHTRYRLSAKIMDAWRCQEGAWWKRNNQRCRQYFE